MSPAPLPSPDAPTTDAWNTLQQQQEAPVAQLQSVWEQLTKTYGDHLVDPLPTFEQLRASYTGFGTPALGISAVFKGMLSFLFEEVLVSGHLLMQLMMLSVLCMVLHTIQSAFERTVVSKTAFSLSYLVVVVLGLQSFTYAVTLAKTAIDTMVHVMFAMVPLLFSMLLALGNAMSASLLHPTVIFAVYMVSTVVQRFIFPAFLYATALHLISTMTDKFSLRRLASWIQNAALATLMVVLSIFLGVISVQSVAGGVSDGVALKTVKVVAGNFIPIVGRILSESTDTILSASLLMKQGIGLVGVLIVVLTCAFPALKIAIIAVLYRLAGALLQPLGDNPVTDGLRAMSTGLFYVFAALSGVGLMCFMAITFVVAASHVSMMVR